MFELGHDQQATRIVRLAQHSNARIVGVVADGLAAYGQAR
jgi:hypothetical protein